MTVKAERKLQQRLNRIVNCMIGRGRIHVLDRLAMEYDMDAQGIEDAFDATDMNPIRLDQVRQFRADALFLRRLEYDLWRLLEAVQNTSTSRANRYRIEQGDRP